MYKEVKIANFRKHRDRSFVLTPGVNVIRGPNEEGKSTLLEALGYLVTGAKALRSPVERVVTYGEAPNTLAVSGVLEVRGIDYLAKRSPRGAEVTYDSDSGLQSVTGQSGVTNFLRELQGATNPAAAQLAYIGQRASRDILTGGTTATATLVDTLSGGGRLAEIIEGVKLAMVLGPTKAEETALVAAEEEHADLVGNPPKAPDLDEGVTQSDLDAAERVFREEQQRMADLGTAQDVWKAFDSATAAHRNHVEMLGRDLVVARQQALTPCAPLSVANAALEQGLSAMQAVSRVQEDMRRFNAVCTDLSRLSEVPCFAMPAAELERALREQVAQLQGLFETRTTLTEEVSDFVKTAAVTRARLKSGLCEVCGQDFSALPSVVEFNATQLAQIKACEDGIAAGRARIAHILVEEAELKSSNADISAALAAHKQALRTVASSPDSCKANVAVGLSTTPMTVKVTPMVWQEVAEIDVKALRLEVEKATRVERAAARVLDLESQIATLAPPEEITGYARVTPEECMWQNDRVRDALKAHHKLADALADRVQKLAKHSRDAEIHAMRVAQGVKDMAERAAALAERKRNNLLKDTMHELRPLAVARVWDAVLGLASRYFSELRGFESIISRSADAFMVDGCHWEDLSVSAQDILGQSIRFALLKVFLPACDTVILDEPTEAADPDRTLRLLVFLKAYGVSQVIMVSHDDVCDSVADNLIVL